MLMLIITISVKTGQKLYNNNNNTRAQNQISAVQYFPSSAKIRHISP